MLRQIIEAAKPLVSERRYFRVLRWIAARARRRSSARFIGVTGSSAKSTTTALLAHILEGNGRVFKMVELNFLQALIQRLAFMDRRTDAAVVEMGILRAGQIKMMAELLRPNVGVVTMVAMEHKSLFGSLEGVAAQKSELVAAVRADGFAVLNADDPHVMNMAQRTRARVVTFGQSEGADYRVIDIRSGFPERLGVTVVWAGGTLPLKTNFVGDHFWLPTLAAAATAIELGVPPNVVASRVASFEPLLERCGVFSAPGGPVFILDTMKAPWHSVQLALDVVAKATAPRKRIVLGHMSDFAGSDQKYRDFYRRARDVADQVIYVGDHAHRAKASKEDVEENRFMGFATTHQAADYVRKTSVPGELILLKGSVDLHLDRIALAWTHNIKCWVQSCGKNLGCMRCGLYELPFEQHERTKGRSGRGRRPSRSGFIRA